MLGTLAPLGRARGARDKALASIAGTATQANRLRQQLAPFNGAGITSPVAYPQHRSSFPKRLAGLAAMLGAGLPLRCVALRAYGMYDTHDDQAEALAQGLKLTGDSLLAFQRDLEARGLADRVLTLVWSEFGRRAEENGSRGTDHGAAGVGMVMGTRARGPDGRRAAAAPPGARPGRQPQGDRGLPERLQLAARAVVRLRRRRRDPQRAGLPAAPAGQVRRLALLGLTVAALVAAAHPVLAARPPARVQVTALEFEYRLSRLTVRQGPALIQLVNYGEDEHDLYVHRIGGTRTFRVRRILPGERATLSIRLLPGRYRLWCAVSDHRARGMRATLRVRR